MNNSYISVDQQNQERQDLPKKSRKTPIAKLAEGIAQTPIETTIGRSHTVKEPDINIELYSTGFFDGLNGLDAQLPHLKDYWDGYAIGYREYYCGLLGLEILADEIPEESLRTLMAA